MIDLKIARGEIAALVSGSDIYEVKITVAPASQARWKALCKDCVGAIDSIVELLQGRLSQAVMERVCLPEKGLFPSPKEIGFSCSCPDWAGMCKHVAAVLYGIAARLDKKPELLFVLRKVDHEELISADLDMQVATTGEGKRRRLATQDLSNIFGIDIEDTTPPAAKKRKTPPRKTARRSSNRESTSKKDAAAGRRKSETSNTKTPPEKRVFTPSGAAVTRLRKHYKMTRSQFSDLLGVSPQTVANWESKRGNFKLQERTLEALTRAWLKK